MYTWNIAEFWNELYANITHPYRKYIKQHRLSIRCIFRSFLAFTVDCALIAILIVSAAVGYLWVGLFELKNNIAPVAPND